MKQCLARFIRTCKFRVEPTTLNRIEWTVSLLMVEARFCVPIVASSMNADLNFDGCFSPNLDNRRTFASLVSFADTTDDTLLLSLFPTTRPTNWLSYPLLIRKHPLLSKILITHARLDRFSLYASRHNAFIPEPPEHG